MEVALGRDICALAANLTMINAHCTEKSLEIHSRVNSYQKPPQTYEHVPVCFQSP